LFSKLYSIIARLLLYKWIIARLLLYKWIIARLLLYKWIIARLLLYRWIIARLLLYKWIIARLLLYKLILLAVTIQWITSVSTDWNITEFTRISFLTNTFSRFITVSVLTSCKYKYLQVTQNSQIKADNIFYFLITIQNFMKKLITFLIKNVCFINLHKHLHIWLVMVYVCLCTKKTVKTSTSIFIKAQD